MSRCSNRSRVRSDCGATRWCARCSNASQASSIANETPRDADSWPSHHGQRARARGREPRLGARLARRLETDALRTAPVGVPSSAVRPDDPRCRGRAARSGTRLRHGHASDDGIVSANTGCIATGGPLGDRLRMRVRHPGHCRAEARRGPRDRGRYRSTGASCDARKRRFATRSRPTSRRWPFRAALRPAECVVANILAGPLIELAPTLTAACLARGDLLLSGLLRTQAYAVKAAYTSSFDIVQVVGRDDWCCIHARRAA